MVVSPTLLKTFRSVRFNYLYSVSLLAPPRHACAIIYALLQYMRLFFFRVTCTVKVSFSLLPPVFNNTSVI